MPRTRENLTRHEWIGLSARVERAADPSLKAMEGRVVDESLRTVTLERADGREAVVQKAGTLLSLQLQGGARVEIDLGKLAFRPQDRVKRAQRSPGRRARRGAKA